jgi:sirohydrochlorin ferrochelatase
MLGIIIVDHGSRQEESNEEFLEVVRRFAARKTFAIVEPAHMEIAAPSIGEAFARAVARGATTLVVHPYFLLPGKHWHEDIPRLCSEAARQQGPISWSLTAPLGQSEKMLDVIEERVQQTLQKE